MTLNRTLLPILLTLLVALSSCEPVVAQEASGFRLTASYDRPGLPVPHWQMQIGPTGEVQYTSDHAAGASQAASSPVVFQLSQSGSSKLQQLLNSSHGMKPCETKAKGLARMGMKSLEYASGGAAPVQCTFNYTENKPLSAAADYLQAVSYTIEQGATLDHLHRYDRLGLDPVMTQLATAFKAGQAQEVQAIRPTLTALVNDEAVLERVREKATELLTAANRL